MTYLIRRDFSEYLKDKGIITGIDLNYKPENYVCNQYEIDLTKEQLEELKREYLESKEVEHE